MKYCRLFTGVAMSLALVACGGGGEGVQSAPPPPQSLVNQTISDLKVSQDFVNDAANAQVVIDGPTTTGVSGISSWGNLSISYDAARKEYALSYRGRTQTFAPADIASDAADQIIYRKSGDDARNLLNLFKNHNGRVKPTQYTALGFWQHITRDETRQYTDYVAFTYGLPTVAAQVPKTGKAAFSTDVFGFISSPGQEPSSFDGQGDFTADFGSGLFSAHSYVTVTKLVTGSSSSGGGLEVSAKGTLSSTDGTFSGTSLFGGERGGSPGALRGRFYGPDAAEIGASFSGQASDGTAYAGSMIGLRDTSLQPDNLTLTSLTSPQLFYTQQRYNIIGQLNWQNSETFTYSPPSSDLAGGQFTINDKVASADPNFTTYRKTFATSYQSQDVTLELYRPGAGNSELALTYTSFGHWAAAVPFGVGTTMVDQYFTYGIQLTPSTQIAAKTGSGRYDGVVYGYALGKIGDPHFAVKGTSYFDVNFSAGNYSGALTMAGTPPSGAQINYGSFGFSGPLSKFAPNTEVNLTRDSQVVGQLETRFYGPDGQEISGAFQVNLPVDSAGGPINIIGITAAKRQ